MIKVVPCKKCGLSPRMKIRTVCKKCHNENKKMQSKTKGGLTTSIYAHQKHASKKRSHRQPEYTKSELKEWLFSQELFHRLYNEWKMSGYSKNLTPSIDRINPEAHYCFNNIQLVTWYINHKKGIKENAKLRGRKCMNIETGTMYDSIREAHRLTKATRANISSKKGWILC